MLREHCPKCDAVLYSCYVLGYSRLDNCWDTWCPNGCKLDTSKIDSTKCRAEEEVAEDKANARLIVAAPALLKACRRVIEDFGCTCPENMSFRVWEQLEAAIAAATGE